MKVTTGEKSDEEKLADDLLNGYCPAVLVKYIGYISLKKSIRDVGKHEQQQICNTCIKIVAHYAGCIKDNQLRKDYTDIIDSKMPQIWNQKASLALSLASIIISKQKKRNQKMLKKSLVKICVQDITLTGIGTGNLAEFFCIVAKIRTETNDLSERRCFVLSSVEAAPLGITSAITLAFMLKYRNDVSYQPNSKKRCIKESDAKETIQTEEEPEEDCYASVAFNKEERIRPSSILNSNANFNNYNDLPTPDESSSVSFICKPFEFYMLKESKPDYKKLTRSVSVSTQSSDRSPRTEATGIEDDLSVDIRSEKSPVIESPSNSFGNHNEWEYYEDANTRAEKTGPLAAMDEKLHLSPAGDPPSRPSREEAICDQIDDNHPIKKKKSEHIPPIVVTEHSITTSTFEKSDPPPSNTTEKTVNGPIFNHPYEHLQNCLSGKKFLEELKKEAERQARQPIQIHSISSVKYRKQDEEESVFENSKSIPYQESSTVEMPGYDSEEEIVYEEVSLGSYAYPSEEKQENMDYAMDVAIDFEEGAEEGSGNELFVLLSGQKNGSYVQRRSNSPPGRLHMPKLRFKQITEYLEDMPWFHGIQRREMAESLIIREGEFLVRQSSTFPGQVILTLMDSEDMPQHVCLVDHEARIRTSENEFNSIVQLIKYHLTNNIPLVYGDIVLFIRKPVYRPGSTPSSESTTPLGVKRFY